MRRLILLGASVSHVTVTEHEHPLVIYEKSASALKIAVVDDLSLNSACYFLNLRGPMYEELFLLCRGVIGAWVCVS